MIQTQIAGSTTDEFVPMHSGRRAVVAESEIVRCVWPWRNPLLTPVQLLESPNRRLFVEDGADMGMPEARAGGSRVTLIALVHHANDDEVERLLAAHKPTGLVAADPFSLSSVLKTNSVFAEHNFAGTHWRDCEGRWCYIAFDRWTLGRQLVYIARGERTWPAGWWISGVPLIRSN